MSFDSMAVRAEKLKSFFPFYDGFESFINVSSPTVSCSIVVDVVDFKNSNVVDSTFRTGASQSCDCFDLKNRVVSSSFSFCDSVEPFPVLLYVFSLVFGSVFGYFGPFLWGKQAVPATLIFSTLLPFAVQAVSHTAVLVFIVLAVFTERFGKSAGSTGTDEYNMFWHERKIAHLGRRIPL